MDFVSANWERVNLFLYSSVPKFKEQIKFKPVAYTEVPLDLDGRDEPADFIGVGWDGTVFVCEFGANKPSSRKNGQARRYRDLLKGRLHERELELDIIPLYVRSRFDEKENIYTLNWGRVPKHPLEVV